MDVSTDIRVLRAKDRTTHQLGVVEDVLQDHDVGFLLGDVRYRRPLRALVLCGQRPQSSGADIPLAHAGDEGSHLDGEPVGFQGLAEARRPLDRSVFECSADQFTNALILFGAGQQSRRIGVLLCRGTGPQQAVGERMEGRDLRQHPSTEAGGDPIP